MSHSHRNEPARARHRQLLRGQLSATSVPLQEYPKKKYSLDNHFGWTVLQKCRIGDGQFPPYLLHCIYCDKPDVPGDREGGGDDKIMYVLYIRGKDGGLEPVDVKETQTAFTPLPSAILLASRPPAPRKKDAKGKRKRSSSDRRRVISDFYYIPIKQRVDAKYDIREDSQGNLVMMGRKGRPRKQSGRSKPKGWQLRAGAEGPEDGDEGAERPEGEEEELTDSDFSDSDDEEEEEVSDGETVSSFLENLKRKYDCTDCFSRNNNVELMETPAEKNRYLYLPKERYDKRHHAVEQDSRQRAAGDL